MATSNPVAARLYSRLGWRFLPGTRIMANTARGAALETFTSTPCDPGSLAIKLAGPGARVPMVPLLAAAHPWQILDANARMYSTRFFVQGSCEGLYSAYQALREQGRGEWFVAEAGAGRLLGLATACCEPREDPAAVRVDGFTHPDHVPAWPPLLRAAIDWAHSRGAARIDAHIIAGDDAKRDAFLKAGFVDAGAAPPLEVQGQPRSAIRLTLAARQEFIPVSDSVQL